MTDVTRCWCARCDEARRAVALAETNSWLAYISRHMILCPECGNKRCPRATWHGWDCTGLNVPGQGGSDYAGDSGASSYFDVVRALTRDPDLLAVIDKVEAEWNAERANDNANDAGVVSGA